MIARKFQILESDFHSPERSAGGLTIPTVISTHRSERAAAVKVRRHNKAHKAECACGGWSLVEIDHTGCPCASIDVHSIGPADCSDRYSAGYGVGS